MRPIGPTSIPHHSRADRPAFHLLLLAVAIAKLENQFLSTHPFIIKQEQRRARIRIVILMSARISFTDRFAAIKNIFYNILKE